MTVKTGRYGGTSMLMEMEEFASFRKGTERYIRRSLDVGLRRRDAVRRWARTDREAESIRAQEVLYAKLDDQFDVVERLASISGEFAKICSTEGTNLKKKPDTKAIGEWLVKSGEAGETYFESLEK